MGVRVFLGQGTETSGDRRPDGEFSGGVGAGIADALDFVQSRGAATVQVPPGVYPVERTVRVPSNVTLQLDNAQLKRAGPGASFRVDRGGHDIRVVGSLQIDGGAVPDRFFYVVGTNRFSYQAETEIANMGLPFSYLMVRDSDQVRITGPFRSRDSAVVRVVDSSHVEVANIECQYARDPGEVPVGFFGKAGSSGIELHDIHINGGGLRPRPLIDISPDPGAPHFKDVFLHDIVLENPPTTTDFHDGIDVDRCEGVRIENVSGSWLNLVLCLMSSDASVRTVRGHDCWGPALQVGDPTSMKEDVSHVVVEACEAVDCGRGYKGPAASGMGVYTSPGKRVTDVVFRDCVSRDTRGVQPYGFGVMAGASGIRLERCRFSGSIAPIINRAGDGSLVEG
jgi:hypothetical protein